MKKILIFIFFVILAIAVLSLFISLSRNVIDADNRVALIRIEGVILDSKKPIEEIKKYSQDPSVKAVVLRVNSPGGGVAPSQEIYDEVVKLKKKKRVIVSMGAVAASGGYYISSPADRIVANPGTVTGSIGVIMEIPNIEGLMSKIGIKRQIVKSGRHKDMASFFRSMTGEEKKIFQTLLDDVHEQFVRSVSEGRGISYETVMGLADGRIFTGKKAKELGLVDELGNLEHAILLAGKLGGIKGEPEVVSRKDRFSLWDFFVDEDFPKELLKERFQSISLKYLLTPY